MGKQRDAFFAGSMYLVDVQGWPADKVHPARPLTTRVPAPDGARLGVWGIHPHDRRALPDPGPDAARLADVGRFSLGHSGNRTLEAPKRSWVVELAERDDLAGMERLNLKAMYNDPSQMREALAWSFFQQAEVPAPRHTFARLGINGTYLGLFSVIEHIDRSFLRSRFGPRDDGNLFKVSCGDLGGGTLERRTGPDGDDSGRQYIGGDDPTYRLKSYSDRPNAGSYDDLAQLARTIDGAGRPGGEARFATDAYAESVRGVFAVDDFLRWAGVNILAGSWDNYFATPANYYLYNGGKPPAGPGDARPDVIAEPYFSFIPWDYDNSFGIDYFGTRWQYTDLLDWPANTDAYQRFNRHAGRSRIPLVTNLLRNPQFRRYYLDHLEHLLDTIFSPAAVDAVIGIDDAGAPAGGGLWDRVAASAYLESSSPWGWPGTGRQFLNDEVYRAGCAQQELHRGNGLILGIHHYVRMRYDRAREQLSELRRTDPAGSSGVTFTAPGVRSGSPVSVG
jgi:CotH kinase protein